MKALLFYYQFLWFISPSIHSNHTSKLSLSEVSQCIYGQFHPPASRLQHANLEHSSHISYCTLDWMGVISSITSILLGKRVPRKEETWSFSSADSASRDYSICMMDQSDVSQMLHKCGFLLCWHDAPKAKKPLWKIKEMKQLPLPPAVPLPTAHGEAMPTHWVGTPFCGGCILTWCRIWGATHEAEEACVMAKTKNTCVP